MKNILLHEGISPINGKPFVVILQTGQSSNRKIGGLLQVWILVRDTYPSVAIHEGLDETICGDCPFRGNGSGKDRICYVNLMAPGAVWKSYRDGNYICWENVDKEKFKALCSLAGGIRWGAYGDPAIIPYHVFLEVSGYTSVNLGYTHQYEYKFSEVYKKHFQASAHSIDQALELQDRGWSTYTVVPENYIPNGDVVCQGGKKTTCSQCKLCNGKTNIIEFVHGTGAKKKAYNKAFSNL